MLAVEGLEKSYGNVAALAGVDLTIGEGEICALLGPNGAGKTTLVAVLAGFSVAFAAIALWRFRYDEVEVSFA